MEIVNYKILELMHGKKKRLCHKVFSYIFRASSKPLARVHPGCISCLSLKAESGLTPQILMSAKLHRFLFFLCSLHPLSFNNG